LFDNYQNSALGKETPYKQTYNPDLLFQVPRSDKRMEIGIDPKSPPFYGFDCWNHYEVSWLNSKGKPMVAIAKITYDSDSPYIVESKSLKLYFNSLNNTQFDSIKKVIATIKHDLEGVIGRPVEICIYELNQCNTIAMKPHFKGRCLDTLDVACDTYQVDPSFLSTNETMVQEVLYSNLLKSNCLVTNQPDWGSVQITYKGKQIDREGLLKYIVSYRNHNEFHEQCIERIFVDIMKQCRPESLIVYGRYTRRGGLDINPYRSTEKIKADGLNNRLLRQ